MCGYIYVTTNLINGKRYIGKHCYSKKEIDPNYIGSGLNLQKSIKKYGIQNFTCKVIEYCDDIKTLNKQEKYWIQYYNATCSDMFYNIASGGDGGNLIANFSKKQKKIINDKKLATRKKNGTDNLSQIMKQYYETHPEQKQILKQKTVEYYDNHPERLKQAQEHMVSLAVSGDLWHERMDGHLAVGIKNANSHECICIETQEVFISCTEAGNKYNIPYKEIWSCCRGTKNIARGYHWCFAEDVARQLLFQQYIGAPRKQVRKLKK